MFINESNSKLLLPLNWLTLVSIPDFFLMLSKLNKSLLVRLLLLFFFFLNSWSGKNGVNSMLAFLCFHVGDYNNWDIFSSFLISSILTDILLAFCSLLHSGSYFNSEWSIYELYLILHLDYICGVLCVSRLRVLYTSVFI